MELTWGNLTDKEQMLILVLRQIRFGSPEVVMHNAEPQFVIIKDEQKIPLISNTSVLLAQGVVAGISFNIDKEKKV